MSRPKSKSKTRRAEKPPAEASAPERAGAAAPVPTPDAGTTPMIEPTAEGTSIAAGATATGPSNEPPPAAAAEPTAEHANARRHPSSSHPPCPKCGGPLYRVHRRLLDRLLSLIRPRRRYTCRSHGCQWEGTLPYVQSKD